MNKSFMSKKFYTINQNNSGGYFIKNDYVDYYVSVQADSVEEAKELLEDIVEDHSDYCSCCGLRWSTWFLDEEDAYDVPSNYGIPLTEMKDRDTFWLEEKVAIIYYADGTKERLNCIDNSVEKLDNWF